MRHSKFLTVLFSLPLTLTLGGCLTGLSTPQQSERVYSQSLTRAQIQQIQMNQQMKVKQKVVQNNSSKKIVYINNAHPQSPVTSGASYYKNPIPVAVQPRVQQEQQAVPYRRQGELDAQAREALQIEQAKQRSLETYVAEDMARRDAAKKEARQIEQAKQNSLTTYAQEQARQNQNRDAEAQQAQKLAQQNAAAAEEARQIELATQESLRTHAEEEAKRQEQAPPAHIPPPLPPSPPSPSPSPEVRQ